MENRPIERRPGSERPIEDRDPINPGSHAELFAKNGVPFAVETFSKFAGLEADRENQLLIQAHEVAAQQRQNMESLCFNK